jgi:hypothetical protein
MPNFGQTAASMISKVAASQKPSDKKSDSTEAKSDKSELDKMVAKGVDDLKKWRQKRSKRKQG